MRRVRVFVAAALTLLGAGAVAVASAGAATAIPRCPRGHRAVLAGDARAVVYRGPGAVVGGCELPGSANVYGRLRPDGRAFLLGPAPWGTTEGVGGVDHETLAGAVVDR